MQTHTATKPLHRCLHILIFCLFLSACAGGSVTSPSENDPTEPASPADDGLPAAMGIVLDHHGNPISFALVGGTEFTTSEGVFSGILNEYPSGWVSVETLGYLTGYARSRGTLKGGDLYETYLTPLRTGLTFDNSNDATLSLVLSNGYEVRIDLVEEDFAVSPRAIQAAAINPLDIGPFFVGLDTGADLKIVSAFGLSSYDKDLELVPLAADAALPISIIDGGNLTESAVLATYDPEKGLWIAQTPKCQRETSENLSCTLETLSSLVAIFDDPSSVALMETAPVTSIKHGLFGAIITHFTYSLQSDIFHSPSLDAAGDYKNALRAYEEWMDEHGDVDPNDPEARKIVDDLIDAARRNAEATGGEAGKTGLGMAATAAMESGDLTTGDQLMSEAAELANELGREDLNESDCGEFSRLLKRAEQIYMFNGDGGLAQQLIDKASEMVVDCDVWRGRITVWMITSSSHPGGLEMKALATPGWYEHHDIQLWTNVETYVLHGTDVIQLIFPEITYIKEDDCRKDIKISGQPTSGNVTLEYQGSYDGYEFQIVEPPSASGSVSIGQKWHFEELKDEECEVITQQQFSHPNYASVIAHGFEYGTPPINLQEILSEGSTGSWGEMGTIRGSQNLNNPDPDLGKYPFYLAHINWSIIHVEPKLPIDE